MTGARDRGRSAATLQPLESSLLRTIFDASPECIKVLARDGTLIEMNAAGLAMVEADSLDDVVGKPVERLVAPEHRRAFKELTRSVFRGEEGSLEFEVTGLKGTRRRLETHAAPLRDERGRVSALIGVTRDVTQQRHAQELLRESEEHHRALVEQLPAVTYIDIADDRCGTVYISPQLETVLGVTPEEWTAVGSHLWLDLIHPDDRETTLEALRRCQDEGTPFDVEYRMVTLDGRQVWIRDRAHRVDVGAEPARLYGVMTDITEHREASAALAESERRFRTLIETSGDIVSIQEPEGTVLYVSPSVSRVLGYAQDEVVGRNRALFAHPEDVAESERAVLEALEAGGAAPIPVRIRHKDGHWVWLEMMRSALFDESGKPAGLVGVGRDITERKRAEQDARESASLLKLALEAGRMMVWQRDLRDGRLLGDTAEDFLRLTGIDLRGAEDPYSAFLTFVHPEDRERVADAIATAIETGGPYEEEYRVVGPDGRMRGIATHGIAVRDETGEPLRILGILRDVTRRREAAEALAESERRFRTLVETSPDMIVLQSVDGAIRYASPAVSATLGYSIEELAGAPTLSFVHPDDAPSVKEITRQALATGTSDVIAPRVRHKDGTWLSIETRTSALVDDSGQPLGLISAGRDVTERVRAQRELEESEELLLLALESAAMGMWSRDLRTLDATWTAGLERLYGLEPGHHLGTYSQEEFLALLHPDDRARLDAELRQRFTPGERYEFEFRTVWPDGSVHWLSARARAYGDEKDKAVRLTGVTQDVTERLRREQELRESEARLRRALDAGRMISWEADVEADESWVTGGAGFPEWEYASTGGSRADFLASIHPSDRESVASAMEAAFSGTRDYDVEFRLAREDGRETWIAARGQVARDDTGRPVRMVGVAMDITERKLAERELTALHSTAVDLLQKRELDELLEQIVRQAALLVGSSYAYLHLLDEDGETVTERVMLGETFEYGAAKLKVGEGVGGRVVKTGKPLAVDDYRRWSRRSRQSDELNLHAVAGVPLRSGKKVVGALGVAHTEEGRRIGPEQMQLLDRFGHLASLALESAAIRRELQEHAADLERLVAERSADAEAARQEAERANLAKSEFLSRMSHELRTPLNAILGFGQLLERDGAATDAAESGRHIVAAGRLLLGLVNEVLDISTIEAGQLALSLEPVPLRDVIEEAARVVQPLASERDIRVNIPEGTPYAAVVADRRRLLEVLLNLLSNAVKYNRDGGTVDVTWFPVSEGRLRVDVIDTGTGIAEEDLALLFLPFERLDAARGVEGTGLGLALAKTLVEAMGGSVGVESRVDEGSRFFFVLPVA